jgi:hypothetical protein
MGGNISFASDISKYSNGGTYKLTYLKVAPNIGYFLSDKLAAGLKIDIEKTKYSLSLNTGVSTSYAFGPFIRYYFLPIENQLNLFVEGNYQHGLSKPVDQNSNTFSFVAGPVFYFNTSVGLEITVAYSNTKNSEATINNNIQFGMGFQIHLEKQ